MIGLALTLSLALQTAAGADADAHVVPTEMCRGYWMLPVTLQPREGDTEARTLWFLHDTGASNTFVDPDSLERISDRTFESGERVNIVDATAGPVQINRLPARITDLDHLSIALGREIDGIMSVHALDDFLLVLDYPNEQMRLREGRLPRPDGETIFSSRGPDRRPWLNIDFAGREQRLLIDSGAGRLTFAVNDIDQFQLTEPAREISGAVRFDRLEARRVSRLDGNAGVAGLSFETPVLEEVSRAALLGGGALRHFVVTLDQQTRRVSLVTSRTEAVPAEPHIEYGAVLRQTQAGLQVARLYDGLPFANAGVRLHDTITHFDGIPVAARGCDTQQSEGTMTLDLLRNGVELQLTAKLTPVLNVASHQELAGP